MNPPTPSDAELGYSLPAPVGYHFEFDANFNIVLVPDEQDADQPIIVEEKHP